MWMRVATMAVTFVLVFVYNILISMYTSSQEPANGSSSRSQIYHYSKNSTGEIYNVPDAEGVTLGGTVPMMMEKIHPNIQRRSDPQPAIPDIKVQSPRDSVTISKRPSDDLVERAKLRAQMEQERMRSETHTAPTVPMLNLTSFSSNEDDEGPRDREARASDEHGPMMFDQSRPIPDIDTEVRLNTSAVGIIGDEGECEIDKRFLFGGVVVIFLTAGIAIMLWQLHPLRK